MATIEPYETQSGRRYMVRYRTPDRRSTKKRGFKTKAAAKDFAATIEVEKMTGAYIAPAAGRITVDDLAVQWKASLVDISESWYERQESIWRIHVQPHWGHWQISKISHGDVQSWVAGLSAADRLPNPLAPKTVRHNLGVLKAILDLAVSDQRLVTNPAGSKIRVPRTLAVDKTALTANQLRALSDETPSEYQTILWVLATSGIRWGEMVALRPRDLLGGRRLRLARSYSKTNSRQVLKDLKGHSLRTVIVPMEVEAMILRDAEDTPREDLIWTAPRKGGPLKPPTKGHWLEAAVKRCHAADEDFPEALAAHELRHTATSLMISSGAHVKTIQRQLGHKSATMTLDQYGHWFDDDLDVIADALSITIFKNECAQNVPKEDE